MLGDLPNLARFVTVVAVFDVTFDRVGLDPLVLAWAFAGSNRLRVCNGIFSFRAVVMSYCAIVTIITSVANFIGIHTQVGALETIFTSLAFSWVSRK